MKFLPHLIIVLVTVTLFYFGAKSLSATQDQADGVTTPGFERGAEIYAGTCKDCHGSVQRFLRNLPAGQASPGDGTGFFNAMEQGPYPMPDIVEFLNEEQRQDLWVFISENLESER